MIANRQRPDRTPLGRKLFAEGVREFNAGGYFEAHDIWEELWQELRGSDRLYLQGLIHLAVGTYHHEMGNPAGAKSQWGKAKNKLSQYPDRHWGVRTRDWIEWIDRQLANNDNVSRPGRLHYEESGFPERLPMAPE